MERRKVIKILAIAPIISLINSKNSLGILNSLTNFDDITSDVTSEQQIRYIYNNVEITDVIGVLEYIPHVYFHNIENWYLVYHIFLKHGEQWNKENRDKFFKYLSLYNKQTIFLDSCERRIYERIYTRKYNAETRKAEWIPNGKKIEDLYVSIFIDEIPDVRSNCIYIDVATSKDRLIDVISHNINTSESINIRKEIEAEKRNIVSQ